MVCSCAVWHFCWKQAEDNCYKCTFLNCFKGAVETFVGIGFCLGPALGGFLYSAGGFKLPFIVMGCALISTLPAVLTLLHETEQQTSEEVAKESTSMFKALRIPGIFMSALSYVVVGSSVGYIDPIFGPHMKQLGESPSHIGLMFLILSGLYALSAPTAGWICDKTKCCRGLLIFGFTVLGVGFLLLGPASFLTFLPERKMWLIYVSLSICGLGGGFSFAPIMPELIRTARANEMPDDSSTIAVLSSIFGSMTYLGATIGPSIAGVAKGHLGFQWSTSIAAFTCFGHALLLSAFAMFELVFHRIPDTSFGLADEEEKPMLANSKS